MKKNLSLLAITLMLFACSKKESPVPSDQGSGQESSFKALNLVVTTTYYGPDITYTTATAGGIITISGTVTVVERGVCFSTDPEPTIEDPKVASGSGPGTFTCPLTGLTPGTAYYIRAYATKKNGVTKYGDEMTFSTLVTPVYGRVTDYDGNEYVTITMGTQTWMLENLRTTHYRNGDPVQNITDKDAWKNLNTAEEKGAWCSFNNNEENIPTYGLLYNWYAVTDPRNLAPVGWHVSSREDWEILQAYLGGDNGNPAFIREIGRKLKEKGLEHWMSPNRATNISGFTALPGGWRTEYGSFASLQYSGRFWTSDMYGGLAFYRLMTNGSRNIDFPMTGSLDFYRTMGHSVRCVKD